MTFDKKNLAAGIEEMRSVAGRLLAWADDLEKAGAAQEASADQKDPVKKEKEEKPAGAGSGKGFESPASGKDTESPVSGKNIDSPVNAAGSVVSTAPTRAEVKAFLTSCCASGYSGQVKALIASFGVNSLSEVPEANLGDLLDAARLLGAVDSGGGPDAG